MDINRLKELAGLPQTSISEDGDWLGPFGLPTADWVWPFHVQREEDLDTIEWISMMSDNDELAYWGGIDRNVDPDDMDFDPELGDPIYVSAEQVAKAKQQIEDAMANDPDAEEEEGLPEDVFLPIWQNTLGLH